MIKMIFQFLAFITFLIPNALLADATLSYPVPDGMARLIVERGEDPLLFGENVLVALNGRGVGTLAKGAKLSLDLAPGIWRVSARTRPAATPSLISVTLKANIESRIRIELDPVRFPSGQGVTGLGKLIVQSMDAPNDDRTPLFLLREVVIEVPEGDK